MAKAKSGAAGDAECASPLSPLASGESPSPSPGEGCKELVLGDYRGQPQQRPGRKTDWSQAKRDKGDISLALFDLPDLGVEDRSELALHVAASSPTEGWRAVPIEITAADGISASRTAARKSVLGEALTALAAGQPHLLDLSNSFEVELVDDGQWLESRDDESLGMGANLAVLGGELIQFGQSEAIGPGQFKLSRLLRGRNGTEWTMRRTPLASHSRFSSRGRCSASA